MLASMLVIQLHEFHIVLGLALFCVGTLGFLIRRSGLIALMCLELMLNGVNLCLVAFQAVHRTADPGVLFLFIVLVAAAEAAIGLSLLVALFRRTGTVWVDDFRKLRG